MWIRSQDKRRLVKCVLFEIGLENPTIFGYAKSGGVILGEYSTKEKALKVLDEIMSWINDLEYARTTKSCRINYVYQMPQDSEVKDNE